MPGTYTTLIGAFLSAFVALMIVVITKEQKVSEFRQAWVDALRSDIADAISSASVLSISLQTREDSRAEMLDAWAKVTAALSRIDLRLNLTEAPHRELEICVREAEALIRRLEIDPSDYDPAAWMALQDRVIAVSRPLLKSEWNRVRDGETMYRATRTVLIVTVFVVPLIFVVTWACRDAGHQQPRRLPAVQTLPTKN